MSLPIGYVRKVKRLYFDLSCGASGDMILAALLDLGAPLDTLRPDLDRTGIPGLALGLERSSRSGISCGRLSLSWDEDRQTGLRHLKQILDIIRGGRYPAGVLERCERVLRRLGEAEAAVHGISLEEVHFHEIGAVDTIVDVLGVSLCLEYLGADEILFSVLTVGTGTIRTEHGILPVPVPATSRMIQGFQVLRLETGTEILTPTGCALLTALGRQSALGLEGRVLGQGCSCGTREIPGFSGLLRVFLLEG